MRLGLLRQFVELLRDRKLDDNLIRYPGAVSTVLPKGRYDGYRRPRVSTHAHPATTQYHGTG